MMARKISQAVCAVSLELLTASSRLYGLTGVSFSAGSRAASGIALPTDQSPPRVQTIAENLWQEGHSVTHEIAKYRTASFGRLNTPFLPRHFGTVCSGPTIHRSQNIRRRPEWPPP